MSGISLSHSGGISGPRSSNSLTASTPLVTLSARLTARSVDGPITRTIDSSVISSAANVDRPPTALRTCRYAGQLAEQATAENRMAGMNG
jgi:hypothetical protein